MARKKFHKILWSSEEDKVLVDSANKLTDIDLAKLLNRSRYSVYQRAKRLGILIAKYNKPTWSEAENQFLEVLADAGCSQTQASQLLNRPRTSIQAQALQLGILWPLGSYRRAYRPDEDHIIKEYAIAGKRIIDAQANGLRRSRSSIKRRSKELGITWTRSRLGRPNLKKAA
jgi:hypothetical protein